MNLNKITTFGIFALLLAAPVQAQFDQFSQPRTLQLGAARLLSGSTQGLTTNNFVDTHGMAGIAVVNISVITNVGGGTLTATLETSPDSTNWTALANYAIASATTVLYTNGFYASTNLVGTNVFIMPGTVVTPTATTAGFATPYLLSAPFTNSAAITLTGTNLVQVAYNVSDAPRYLHIYWTPGGATTNCGVSAVLIGRKSNFP